MKRRRKSQIPRRIGAITLTVTVLWVIFATAGSSTLSGALSELSEQGRLSVALLRHELGDSREGDGWLNAATALVIGTICGLTYKVLISYNYGHGFSIVPASRADDVSSITTAVYGLGSFLCTYFATWLMQLMHTDLVTPTWYVGAIGFILITVLDIFVALRERKRFGA